jgi:hypothetical protein
MKKNKYKKAEIEDYKNLLDLIYDRICYNNSASALSWTLLLKGKLEKDNIGKYINKEK